MSNHILEHLMTTVIGNCWPEITHSTLSNFTHSSQKAWVLHKKLVSENVGNLVTGIVTPNNVAFRLIRVEKIEMDKLHTREVKRKLRKEIKIREVKNEEQNSRKYRN